MGLVDPVAHPVVGPDQPVLVCEPLAGLWGVPAQLACAAVHSAVGLGAAAAAETFLGDMHHLVGGVPPHVLANQVFVVVGALGIEESHLVPHWQRQQQSHQRRCTSCSLVAEEPRSDQSGPLEKLQSGSPAGAAAAYGAPQRDAQHLPQMAAEFEDSSSSCKISGIRL